MSMNINKPFAVFVVCQAKDGTFAATSRPPPFEYRIGLPGGKVDPDETPHDAAFRECVEEGWHMIEIDKEPFHTAQVDGNLVWWFRASECFKIRNGFKESGRIVPKFVTFFDLQECGFGNGEAMAKWLDLKIR